MKQSLKIVFTKGNEKKSPADSADLRRKKSAIISEICGNYFQMKNKLFVCIQQFFQSYLSEQRGLSQNTINSYKDTIKLYADCASF
mgnify:CR=1 FL=1